MSAFSSLYLALDLFDLVCFLWAFLLRLNCIAPWLLNCKDRSLPRRRFTHLTGFSLISTAPLLTRRKVRRPDDHIKRTLIVKCLIFCLQQLLNTGTSSSSRKSHKPSLDLYIYICVQDRKRTQRRPQHDSSHVSRTTKH